MLEEGDNHFPALPGPSQPETATPRVLTILSSVLEKLVARNDRLALLCLDGGTPNNTDGGSSSSSSSAGFRLGKSLSAFHGVRAPSISIPKYIERIYKYTNCSPSCFVVGYVYMDRLAHKYPNSLVISLNVHRLLVTCVMVASKILDDEHYNNAFFARVGGVSNAELNKLEIELLFLLDFGVSVSSQVFECYCQHLDKEILQCNGIGADATIINIIQRGVEALDDDITLASSPPPPPPNFAD
ncbi:PREDICTED: cyclin-U1-1 [Ipomoea nil]|uniref:cyclin-U1-1 n=1 Tax=Ipomoea nil TaxID=35883 RepID=UPI0009013A77|nr:PREDICTED: cyclin-U1-1 [Ipomoea nil]XP_019193049.1 PREDICTED: cyclin-U1-1 [Ipomoea nil]